MDDLRLAVKKKYFNQIKWGNKPDEYRADNEYWRKRLINRQYDNVIITLGYPKADDKERILIFPYTGYKMTHIAHEHFNNGKAFKVFAIKLYEWGK